MYLCLISKEARKPNGLKKPNHQVRSIRMRPIPVSVDSQVSTKSSKHQRSTKQLSITVYPNNRPQRHPTPHPPLRSLEQSRKPILNPFYEPHVDLPLIESVPLHNHSSGPASTPKATNRPSHFHDRETVSPTAPVTARSRCIAAVSPSTAKAPSDEPLAAPSRPLTWTSSGDAGGPHMNRATR